MGSSAHRAQLAPQRLLGHRHLKLVRQPLDQVNDPPAHHAVDRRQGAVLDRRRQGRPMRVGQDRLRTGSLVVDQAGRPVCVELDHPVADDLQRNTADLGCLGAACPIIDRGQREEPPGLPGILALARCPANTRSVKVGTQGDGHGGFLDTPPSNQIGAASGKPGVRGQELWY